MAKLRKYYLFWVVLFLIELVLSETLTQHKTRLRMLAWITKKYLMKRLDFQRAIHIQFNDFSFLSFVKVSHSVERHFLKAVMELVTLQHFQIMNSFLCLYFRSRHQAPVMKEATAPTAARRLGQVFPNPRMCSTPSPALRWATGSRDPPVPACSTSETPATSTLLSRSGH